MNSKFFTAFFILIAVVAFAPAPASADVLEEINEGLYDVNHIAHQVVGIGYTAQHAFAIVEGFRDMVHKGKRRKALNKLEKECDEAIINGYDRRSCDLVVILANAHAAQGLARSQADYLSGQGQYSHHLGHRGHGGHHLGHGIHGHGGRRCPGWPNVICP